MTSLPTLDRLRELEARLREADETLDAIRNGDVDAVVVGGPGGQRVYTLENADRPYRVLIEQMREGAVTLSGDGTVLYCNQRFAALVETPREAILGRALDRFVIDGERDGFRELLARGPGRTGAGEFTLAAAGAAEVPVNISLVDLKVEEAQPRLLCGVVTDLTHYRKRSQELAAANQRLASEIEERRRVEESLQLALDAAGMGSWDLDLASGAMLRSLRHDQIFGHPDLLRSWSLQSALSHFLPEDRDSVAEAFAEAETSGSIEIERRIRRAGDGATRWLHLKGRTIFEDGRPVRILGVVTDVTERREVDEQLRQAQKMEAVGQLTGGIAHDFNNLLMIIGGNLEMLERRVATDERAGKLFDAARQGVARGAKLNQQLLAFSRRQNLSATAVCVDDLVRGFEHLLDRAVGEMITVGFRRSPQVWFCRTDPHQLETAILNLAINARDAMPEGGALTLGTENRVVSAHSAAVWGASAGEYVVVSVADTGIGIASEILDRVFEPFFTTKEVGRGTGLGLSQVYGFAKQSGGFVTVESELGRGTKVAIHLPRTTPPGPSLDRHPPEAAEVEGRGVILLVEDDREVRATTTAMLQDLGYEVRDAETGRVALAFIESGHQVDLVLTDVVMPDGMNGVELAKEIERRRPGLPILLTSGYAAYRHGPLSLGEARPLLRKPYAQTDLSRAVLNAIRSTPARPGPRH